MPVKNPPNPGEFIRTEIIEAAGLSVTAAAAGLQVSRPALSSLLNGKADLSGSMALRIEKGFGVKLDTLMRMQAAYDVRRIHRDTEGTVLERSGYDHFMQTGEGAKAVRQILEAEFGKKIEEATGGEPGFAVYDNGRRLVVRVTDEFDEDYPNIPANVKQQFDNFISLLRQSKTGRILITRVGIRCDDF
jgi:addiction module HigA family antidote